MLQIEEWFRRPQRKTVARTISAARPVKSAVKTESARSKMPEKTDVFEETAKELAVLDTFEQPMESSSLSDAPEEMFEQEDPMIAMPKYELEKEDELDAEMEDGPMQTEITLQDAVAEAEELDHITEKIGMDVSEMIDMKNEDILLQQIDEFREKAKQLQQLMKNREAKAKELQGVVDEREAKASELDSLIHVRKGEADKIMRNVSVCIDEMSAGVRKEMSGLSDTFSREVGGLTQNLTQEINLSTEKTCQVVENATQQMIDQNTRSLEGLKEQLEQLGQLEQINELSTEMNSQITTLKTDIEDKIHAEDVKCYRNIQASMDEQSKLLSEADEKTRQHIQEQMDNLNRRMRGQSRIATATLCITILNFLGVVGILVFLLLF